MNWWTVSLSAYTWFLFCRIICRIIGFVNFIDYQQPTHFSTAMHHACSIIHDRRLSAIMLVIANRVCGCVWCRFAGRCISRANLQAVCMATAVQTLFTTLVTALIVTGRLNIFNTSPKCSNNIWLLFLNSCTAIPHPFVSVDFWHLQINEVTKTCKHIR